MKQYKVFGVRLPLDASARIKNVSERGVQKSVLLRSVILNWIEKVQHKKHWKKKLLARLCGVVARTALPELFSWVISKLLD